MLKFARRLVEERCRLGATCLLIVAGLMTVAMADDSGPIVASGASFSEPKGWSRHPPSRPKTKAYFVSPESKPPSPSRIILVDIGKSTHPDLLATAEYLAKEWGGTVLGERTTLDGVEAIRVRVAKPSPGLQPIEGIVARRGERIYMILGGSVPGRSVVDEVEQVRKGWKWVDEK